MSTTAPLSRRSLLLSTLAVPALRAQESRPNIVWIIGDDLGVELGCYGYKGVATSNMDRLAGQSVRFAHCHTTAPICSASRSAFQTGVYQTTTRTQGHRSHRQDGYRLPAPVRPVMELMREAGYFCCNAKRVSANFQASAKTDFNFEVDRPYDGSDWKDRKNGQPFFAQINLQAPHKGPAFVEARQRPGLVDPARVELPPYFPDHPVIRDEMANYLDAVQLVDSQVGEIMKRLEQEQLLDNTWIFLFGDNGRCLIRAKQWLYEVGTHVPLIVRRPKARGQGTLRHDLCISLDVTASTLDAAGVPVPRWMHGRALFAKGYKPRDYIVTARDRCGIQVDRIRSVRTSRYRLIRNEMPERPYTQPNGYITTQYPTLGVLKQLHAAGKLNAAQSLFMASSKPKFELYDLQADPHEIRNLASDAAHQPLVQRLDALIGKWSAETGDRSATPEDPRELAQAMDEDTVYGTKAKK